MLSSNQPSQPAGPIEIGRDNNAGVKEEVYIMPEKFHPQKSGSGSKPLVIALIVLFLVMLASGLYFFYASRANNNQAPANNEENFVPTENTANNNQPATTTEEIATSSPDLLEAATSTEPVIPDEENLSENDYTVVPQFASDTDSDGLTDIEESVFGTSPSKPDTDGDGYIDGQEVANGYNPMRSGSQTADKLPAADFIFALATDFAQNNFSLLSIKDWTTASLEAIGEVRITAPTGETVRIYTENNPDNLSAANWFLQAHPQVTLSQLKTLESPQLKGVFSPSGLQAYLTDNNKKTMYILEYNLSNSQEFRYPAIFNMIVKSLQPLAKTAVINQSPSLTETATETATGTAATSTDD